MANGQTIGKLARVAATRSLMVRCEELGRNQYHFCGSSTPMLTVTWGGIVKLTGRALFGPIR